MLATHCGKSLPNRSRFDRCKCPLGPEIRTQFALQGSFRCRGQVPVVPGSQARPGALGWARGCSSDAPGELGRKADVVVRLHALQARLLSGRERQGVDEVRQHRRIDGAPAREFLQSLVAAGDTGGT